MRTFELAEHSSDLTVSQTMRNAGDAPTLRVNHWGRTFVPGGGIALVPLPADGYSRFPNKYCLYDFTPPASILFQVRKTPLLCRFILKTAIPPRQAENKHR